MKLTRLRLFDFRNYETLDLTLDPGVNLILGENAQGKTNLLEAVGYLSTGRSFLLFWMHLRNMGSRGLDS